jgi:hypothetical protein
VERQPMVRLAGRGEDRDRGRRVRRGGDRSCAAATAGEFDTAVSLVVADGRITRIYAMRNPHKLARLNEEATLSR